MLTLHKGFLALAATGLLFSAANAENPQAVRDPFVNQKTPAPYSSPQRPSRPPVVDRQVAPTVRPVQQQVVPTATPSETVVVKVPAPEVTVSGILSSQGQRQAILQSGSNSYIVKVGQKLSDYRVSAIDASSVTLSAAGQKFRIPLAQ